MGSEQSCYGYNKFYETRSHIISNCEQILKNNKSILNSIKIYYMKSSDVFSNYLFIPNT